MEAIRAQVCQPNENKNEAMNFKQTQFIAFKKITKVWCQILVSENAENEAKCKIKPSETQCLQQTFRDS